jgi:hypothetical protein
LEESRWILELYALFPGELAILQLLCYLSGPHSTRDLIEWWSTFPVLVVRTAFPTTYHLSRPVGLLQQQWQD